MAAQPEMNEAREALDGETFDDDLNQAGKKVFRVFDPSHQKIATLIPRRLYLRTIRIAESHLYDIQASSG
jgi:hypothetical protein